MSSYVEAPENLSHYKLIQKLGQGRMGVVYRAWDQLLLRPVAIKVLLWSFSQKGMNPVDWFLGEARNVAQIDHPNVVKIFSVGNSHSIHYIAMELVDGPSLMDLIEEKGTLPFLEATHLLRGVADGLWAAHMSHIIHRDIKPANILISPQNEAKLTQNELKCAIPKPKTAKIIILNGKSFCERGSFL